MFILAGVIGTASSRSSSSAKLVWWKAAIAYIAWPVSIVVVVAYVIYEGIREQMSRRNDSAFHGNIFQNLGFSAILGIFAELT